MGGAQLSEYVRGRPHPALSRHVLRYGGYREYSSAPVRRRQVPTGTCTLILSFGPPLRLAGPAGPSITASFLAGLHDAAVVTEFSGDQHGLQVDLTPLGAYELLGRPMDELTNIAPRVDELDAPELASLPARLAEDPGWPERFARVDRVLRGRLDTARLHPDAEVVWALDHLVASGGRIGVQQLAERIGWSRRHLLTRFHTQVGLAPKPMARVLRLQRAAGLLVPIMASGGPGKAVRQPLADVAAACGYADHAHLVREFRALAGCTPTEYLAEWS